MCIQWCCKNCPGRPTKLTHRWARERCNEYFIARSKNQDTASCPIGPWELRRAYHRHPYRGPQICDNCKGVSRKDKKLMQSARQRANVALGQRPEYNGAMELGELEIPETFHGNARGLFGKGRVEDRIPNWESCSETNVRLPPLELNREWAHGFAAFNDVGSDGRGYARQPSKLASNFRKRMSGEDGDQVHTTLLGDASQDQHQLPYHLYPSSAYGRNEDISSYAISSVRRRPNPTVNRPDIKTADRTDSRCVIHLVNYEHNIISDTKTGMEVNKQNTSTAKEASPPATRYNHHYQYSNNIYSPLNYKSHHSATVKNRETLQDPDRGQIYRSSTTNPWSPPSQPIRRRPWDL